jgi:hypothetical protein
MSGASLCSSPGEELALTRALDPATYVLLCFLPSPQGEPHGRVFSIASRPSLRDVAAGTAVRRDTRDASLHDGSPKVFSGRRRLWWSGLVSWLAPMPLTSWPRACGRSSTAEASSGHRAEVGLLAGADGRWPRHGGRRHTWGRGFSRAPFAGGRRARPLDRTRVRPCGSPGGANRVMDLSR